MIFFLLALNYVHRILAQVHFNQILSCNCCLGPGRTNARVKPQNRKPEQLVLPTTPALSPRRLANLGSLRLAESGSSSVDLSFKEWLEHQSWREILKYATNMWVCKIRKSENPWTYSRVSDLMLVRRQWILGKTDFLKHTQIFSMHITWWFQNQAPKRGLICWAEIYHESPPLPDDVCLGGSATWIRRIKNDAILMPPRFNGFAQRSGDQEEASSANVVDMVFSKLPGTTRQGN